MIGIIDYGMGNLRSVQKAIEHVSIGRGVGAVVSADPQELKHADKLILPGVGAFADGMKQLKRSGWDSFIKEYIEKGKPFLGICLGLQLLFESSQEGAVSGEDSVPGLGILPGQVVRFSQQYGNPGEKTETLKIPHMGWNNITWRRNDPLLQGLEQGSRVYFVHSYYALPNEEAGTITSSICAYGVEFTASVWRDNVWACQFHPEKSQQIGLSILKNFTRI